MVVLHRELSRNEDQQGFLKANFEVIAREARFCPAAKDVIEAYQYYLRHPDDETAKGLLDAKLDAYTSE